MLRSACTLNHLTDPRQASKPDQFVTVQCSVVINNHTISIHDKTRIYDGSGPIAICHSSERKAASLHGHQFAEISYAQIELSIADTYCCVMICS
jgi:hypothetical protein